MSGWERRKSETRERILASARRMIGETGETELSMRALALRSEVSLATPYNLFGSKSAILQAVLAADVEAFVNRVSTLASADAVERILDALDLAVALYDQEPKFYRTLFRTLFNTGSRDLASMFNPPRRAFWKGLVETAIREGTLAKGLDAGHFASALGHSFGAIMLEWIEQEMTPRELRATFGFEILLLLSGAATAKRQADLRRRAFGFQAELIELRTRRRRVTRQQRVSADPDLGSRSTLGHEAQEPAARSKQ